MRVALIFCCFFVCFNAHSQIVAGSRVDSKISFIPVDNRIDIKVAVEFPVISNEPFLIGNLRDYYGYARLGKFMTSLQGKKGTVVSRMPTDSILIKPSDNKAAFTYTLSYDSASFSDNTYGPNVGVHHVHFAFCQWMLPLAERNVTLDYRIQIPDLPKT
jgi:hypothetical protein